MAKKKKKSGLGVAFASIIILIAAIIGGYYFWDKNYSNKNNETTTVEATTKSVISSDSPYVTLEDGDYKGITIYKVYKNVFDSNDNIITKTGEYKLNEYLNSKDTDINSFGDTSFKGYASVDLDGDSIDEVVLKLEGSSIVYAILHFKNDKVYGYSYIKEDDLKDLKVDGSFKSLESENDYSYYKYSFEETTIIKNGLASKSQESYTVDGVESSYDNFASFEKKYNNKTNASFIDIN